MLKKDQVYALFKILSPNSILIVIIIALLLWLLNYSFLLVLPVYLAIATYTFYSTKSDILKNIKKLNVDRILVKIESKNTFLVTLEYFTFDHPEKIITSLIPRIQNEVFEFIKSDKDYHFVTESHLKKMLILKIRNF